MTAPVCSRRWWVSVLAGRDPEAAGDKVKELFPQSSGLRVAWGYTGNWLLLTSDGLKTLKEEFCLVFVQKTSRRRALLEYFLFLLGKMAISLICSCTSAAQSCICCASRGSSRCLVLFLAPLRAEYVVIAVAFNVRG